MIPRLWLCTLMVALLSVPAQAADDVADFNRRLHAYIAIQERLRSASLPMRTRDPANVKASQQQLASRIRAVRHGARQGDFFTPGVEATIQQGVEEFVRRTARDESAPQVELHAACRERSSCVPLPASVLAILPQLPSELQFRLAGRQVILYDVHANIVLDFTSAVN